MASRIPSSGVRNFEVSASEISKTGLWLQARLGFRGLRGEGQSLCRTVRSPSSWRGKFKIRFFGEGFRVVWGLEPLEKKEGQEWDPEEQGLTVTVGRFLSPGEDTQIEGAKGK